MRGTGALARASMADLKPDRIRAAELAQTGAGRGWARGEQAEREHESKEGSSGVRACVCAV